MKEACLTMLILEIFKNMYITLSNNLKRRPNHKKKLNILNLGPVPPRIGGSAFVNIETLISLAQKGHTVNCISNRTKSDLYVPGYDSAWKKTGVNIDLIDAQFIPSSVPPTEERLELQRKQILDKFYKYVDQQKPDVLMVGHESFSYYANEEARKLGIPVVQVLHGTPTHGIDEGIYPEEQKNLFLDSLNEATLIVGVSKYLSSILNSHGINQTTYIYNGTDTKFFKPTKTKSKKFLKQLGITLGQPVVMHASTLRAVKRPLDIVESAYYATQENKDLVYVIVGNGPLKEPMEARAKELGIYNNFRFVDAVPFSQIPKYFQHADMFLLPSEHEGFGRVVRESQACKAVPITSDIGPLPEIIDDGWNGSLFKKGDVRGLAQAVLSISGDKDLRMRLGENGRKSAVHYNLTKMIGDYECALSAPDDFLSRRPTV